MANARTTKPRATSGKPPARSVVRTPRVEVVAADAVAESDGEDDVLPVAPAACAFPLEVQGGRCPVAVFNSPNSPNEKIAWSSQKHVRPLAFERGLLAVFADRDAQLVRNANPGGKTYLEADLRLGDNPFICSDCFPRTRWYSAPAYQRHMRFAHSDG